MKWQMAGLDTDYQFSNAVRSSDRTLRTGDSHSARNRAASAKVILA